MNTYHKILEIIATHPEIPNVVVADVVLRCRDNITNEEYLRRQLCYLTQFVSTTEEPTIEDIRKLAGRLIYNDNDEKSLIRLCNSMRKVFLSCKGSGLGESLHRILNCEPEYLNVLNSYYENLKG